ncbi:MAG: VOC family protein [Acidimicrobiia bacterium]|nr:VOC family protein [Acidimicrobiia bacterium]
MELRAIGVTLDSNDPEMLADFWQRAIGFRKREGDGDPYITLSDSDVGRPLNHLTIQRVPEAKAAKHRMHLDLFVSDDDVAIAELEALGASVIVPAVDVPEDGDHDEAVHGQMRATVMADPEGGEFCVVCRRR